jgi:quercetin dioxygenase-like cupin family protein
MGVVHRFMGTNADFQWEGVAQQAYGSSEVRGVSICWLIGPAEGAPNFAIRYFEIAPGERTSLDRHEHDHGVVVLRGRGQVLLGDEASEVSYGDAVYVPPNEPHQFRCTGDDPLGFLCVIPARRSGNQ